MSEPTAHTLLLFLGLYAGLGLLWALFLAFSGLPRLDPTSRGSGLGFRLLILPGLAALWPWALWRWWRGPRQAPQAGRAHRMAHAWAWLILTPAIAGLAVAGVLRALSGSGGPP